jgi:hypothetical protein
MSSNLERLALKKVRKRFPALKRRCFAVAVRQTCGSEFASIGHLGFLPDGWFVGLLLHCCPNTSAVCSHPRCRRSDAPVAEVGRPVENRARD